MRLLFALAHSGSRPLASLARSLPDCSRLRICLFTPSCLTAGLLACALVRLLFALAHSGSRPLASLAHSLPVCSRSLSLRYLAYAFACSIAHARLLDCLIVRLCACHSLASLTHTHAHHLCSLLLANCLLLSHRSLIIIIIYIISSSYSHSLNTLLYTYRTLWRLTVAPHVTPLARPFDLLTHSTPFPPRRRSLLFYAYSAS